MEEDLLTFERLRDIRKEERNTDTLSELEEGFFQKVGDYLERKRRIGSGENSGEYKNALHMVEDIIDTRAKKVMKIAFLSTKTRIPIRKLLEREQKLFKQLKEPLEEHQKLIDNIIDEEGSQEDEPEEVQDKEETEDEDKGKETEKEEEKEESGSKENEYVEESIENGGEEPDNEEENKSPGTEESSEDEEDSGGELLFDASTLNKKESSEEKTGSEPQMEQEEVESPSKTGKDGKIEIVEDMKEFVGPDMEKYGPFEEGEEVDLGKEVAELLLEQGKARRT